MARLRRRVTLFGLLITVVLAARPAAEAQERTLALRPIDPAGRPHLDVALRAVGGLRPAIAGRDGVARVPVGDDAAPGRWVAVSIAGVAAAEDLAWLDPVDGFVRVPPSGRVETAVPVTLAERGRDVWLDHPRTLIRRMAAVAIGVAAADEPFAAALAVGRSETAADYDLWVRDVDAAVRAWAGTAREPVDRGLALLYEGDFASAGRALTDALAAAERTAETDPGPVIDRAFLLGVALAAEQRDREAAEAFARAVALRPNDPRLLGAQGRMLVRAGDYRSARPLLDAARAATETHAGVEHRDFAVALADLARWHQRQGRAAQATSLLERAVAVAEGALGPAHAAVGTWLYQLGSVHAFRNRPADAVPRYERAVAIAESWFGPEHPTVGVRVNGLAGAYQALGRLTEAEAQFTRALRIAETTDGPTHPRVGIRLNNLALNLQAQGRHAEAERLFGRAHGVLEDALGPRHPNVAAVLQNLSMLLRAMGRSEEGAELERRAQAAVRGR